MKFNQEVYKFCGQQLCRKLVDTILSLHMSKAITRSVGVATDWLIMTSLAKQFAAPQIFSIMKFEKVGMTDVYNFTISSLK